MYGPQEESDKIQFLEELKTTRLTTQGPSAIMGDFNLILEAKDKNNQNLNRRLMGKFRRLVDGLELSDILLNDHVFTWSNDKNNTVLCKIDRNLQDRWQNRARCIRKKNRRLL